jgi:sulfate transport system ATP-binding protein
MSILLERLTKRFAGHPVVDQVTVELHDGELFVLLGPSGSGKSTILRLIAGLVAPDEGRIVLKGRDVTALPPQRRSVGFVFQNYSIFRHMTAAQNIEFGLRIRKVDASERARRRERLLELVDLGGLGNRRPHQLSGGQLQRIALARALAYEPDILLLDEPFGALDAKIRVQLRRTLRTIQRELSVTTMLVTHDQEEAFEVGDRIGVVERGRLRDYGTPQDLYERPRSLFSATFIGAGAVLAGRAHGPVANFGTFSIPIPPEVPHEEGTRVRMLFRPEEVQIARDAAEIPGLILGEGTVVEEGFLGGFRRLRLRLPLRPPARQIAPAGPFGEEGMLVDTLVPSATPLPAGPLWVGLTSWRVLDPPPPRVLVADNAGEAADSLRAGAEITRAIHGAAAVVGVAAHGDGGEALLAKLRKRAEEAGLREAEIRVRTGSPVGQILGEQAESLYDILVTAVEEGAPRKILRSRAAVRRLSAETATPMLVLKGPWRMPRRLLICTAIGEPGKNDIRLGGWLARWLGASVTLLHVSRSGVPPTPLTQEHLERGLRTLRALGVECRSLIKPAASVSEGILAQAAEEDAHAIVIGRHGPVNRSLFGREDVATQILAASTRPVLIVPENA